MRIDDVWHDVRYALRTLSRARAFSAVIISTLALGMGAAIGVFAVINATLLADLPYPEANRLVMLSTDRGQFFSRPAFRRLKTNPAGLELPAATESQPMVLTSSAMPERLWVQRISIEMTRLLGLTDVNRPILGRLYDTDQTKAEHEVLLTHRAWRNRFGARPGVLGESVTLDGITRQIVGVLGPRVDLFPESEFLLPLNENDGLFAYNATHRTLQIFGRLPDGLAAADMTARLAPFFRSLPASPRGQVEFVQDRVVQGFRTTLLTMWLAALFVLLVCCLNFATLLSTRFWARGSEFALRVRLGATEGRLVRQLVTEGILVSIAGGIAGVLLAWMTRGILVKALTNDAMTAATITFDAWLIAAVAFSCAAIGILFTLKTARQVSATSLSPAGGRPVMPRRRIVSAVHVAAAMVLVGTSAALIQSLARLQTFEVGYDVDDTVTVRVDLPPDTTKDTAAIAEFVGRAQAALAAIPGIERVSATSALPHVTSSGYLVLFQLEQEPPYEITPEPAPLGAPPLPPPPPPPPSAPPSERYAVYHRALSFVTTPGFFQTMGIPVVRGRSFADSDDASAERVAIINEAFARRYFAHTDPLFKRIRRNPRSEWMTVVGVVRDIRRSSMYDQARAEFYRPYEQMTNESSGSAFEGPVNRVALVAKTERSADDVNPAIRSALFSLDRQAIVAEVSTLRAGLDARLEERRNLLRLFVALSSLTLVLAATGVYGVTNYFVRQRLPELGVRAALGATRRQLIWLPMRDSVVVLAMGLPIGLLCSVVTVALVRPFLPDVQPYDWSVLFKAASVLAGCVGIAAYVAARRGALADPVVYMNAG